MDNFYVNIYEQKCSNTKAITVCIGDQSNIQYRRLVVLRGYSFIIASARFDITSSGYPHQSWYPVSDHLSEHRAEGMTEYLSIQNKALSQEELKPPTSG